MISSQLAFSKSEINRFWLTFFQFLLNIFDLDFGEFAKKSSIIANSGRWSETVDLKLPDIMFELKVTLQKMSSIKVEELETVVGSNMRGDIKLNESVSQQNYWQVQMFQIAANLC